MDTITIQFFDRFCFLSAAHGTGKCFLAFFHIIRLFCHNPLIPYVLGADFCFTCDRNIGRICHFSTSRFSAFFVIRLRCDFEISSVIICFFPCDFCPGFCICHYPALYFQCIGRIRHNTYIITIRHTDIRYILTFFITDKSIHDCNIVVHDFRKCRAITPDCNNTVCIIIIRNGCCISVFRRKNRKLLSVHAIL